MNTYRFTLSLTLQAPVLTQSVGALGFGFDMSTLRDDGVPVLPGSLIRGNLRENLVRFAEVLKQNGQADKAVPLETAIRGWFGPRPPEPDEDAFDQNRASFNFDYYWRCQPFARASFQRNRIKLDPDTGTVEKGALLVIDATDSQDRQLVFSGNITARLENAEKAEEARLWLDKAAQFLASLGSLKGVGYGRVLSATVAMEESKPPNPPPLPASTHRLGICLSLDRSFCVAQARAPHSNQFNSEERIPGAVLKAVLAQGFDDKASFDKLVFTHALPAPTDAPARRPVLPTSLAWVGEAWDNRAEPSKPIRENLVDLALLDCDGGVFVCNRTGRAAKFQIDWKPKEYAAARALIASLPGCNHHLAVHTAINVDTGQAEESQLFSLDCVDPKGMVWCADIDLSALDPGQQKPVAGQLNMLLSQPLVGIGKTKAIAKAAIQQRPYSASAPLKAHQGCFIVTLQTDAELFADADAQALPASGGGEDLHALYAAYWQKASDNSLTLKRFFASQRREGGAFVWHRYLKAKTSPDKAYRPFWLTQAGSVFVLEVVTGQEQQAEAKLSDWQSRGLPPPGKATSHQDWPHNPYIRENGYGEICVNDPVHVDFQALKEEWR